MSSNKSAPTSTIDNPLMTHSAARGRSIDRYLVRRFSARFGWYSVLGLLTIISIFPLVWMVLTSFRPRYEALGGPLLPSSLTLEAYNFVFSDFHILGYFGNSLVVSTVSVLVVVALSTLAGYAFAHMDFWGKEPLFVLLLCTLMVPSSVLVLPLFLQLRDFDLIDKHAGLMLAYISGGMAFSVFLMRSYFKGLPSELIDAGRVDGASEFGIFWRIMAPLARPGIATVLIFQFRDTWNEFLYAATFVHNADMRTLQPAIFSMIGRYSTNWPALTAALTLSVLPLILIYLFMQRQFVSGLTAGAVKQ